VEYFEKNSLYPVVTAVNIVLANKQKERVQEEYWNFVPEGSKVPGVFDLPLSCNARKRDIKELGEDKWFQTFRSAHLT